VTSAALGGSVTQGSELYSAAVMHMSTSLQLPFSKQLPQLGSGALPSDVPTISGRADVIEDPSVPPSIAPTAPPSARPSVSPSHIPSTSPSRHQEAPEAGGEWPRLMVECIEKPALSGSYDVLYAGNRRFNGRPMWACHAKRLYSCVAPGGQGHWAIAVGNPLESRPQVQSRLPHEGLPSSSDAWEWFSTEEGKWLPAPGTSIKAITSPGRHSGPPAPWPISPALPSSVLPLNSPGTGRLVSAATVREEMNLESPTVGEELPPGVVVEVVEIRGRRARIIAPVEGWLSLHTGGMTLVTAHGGIQCEEFGCNIIDSCPPALADLKNGNAFEAGLREGDRLVWLQKPGGGMQTLSGAADIVQGLANTWGESIRIGYTRDGHSSSTVVNIEQHTAPVTTESSPVLPSPASPPTVTSPTNPSSPITRPSLRFRPATSSAPAPRLSEGADGVWLVMATAVLVDESPASRVFRLKVLNKVQGNHIEHVAVRGVRVDMCCKNDALYTALFRNPPSKEVGLKFQRAVRGAFESMAMAGKGSPGFVEKKAFRLLLIALRRHLEMYQIFGCMCVSIDAVTVQRSIPVLARWGSAVLEASDVLANATGSPDSDSCPFPKFCAWAAATNLADVAREEAISGKHPGKSQARASRVAPPVSLQRPSLAGTRRTRPAPRTSQKTMVRSTPRESRSQMTPPRRRARLISPPGPPRRHLDSGRGRNVPPVSQGRRRIVSQSAPQPRRGAEDFCPPYRWSKAN